MPLLYPIVLGECFLSTTQREQGPHSFTSLNRPRCPLGLSRAQLKDVAAAMESQDINALLWPTNDGPSQPFYIPTPGLAVDTAAFMLDQLCGLPSTTPPPPFMLAQTPPKQEPVEHSFCPHSPVSCDRPPPTSPSVSSTYPMDVPFSGRKVNINAKPPSYSASSVKNDDDDDDTDAAGHVDLDLSDLKGTTAARSRKMTEHERTVMLHKRRLRNRASAARSREKQRNAVAVLSEQVATLSSTISKLRRANASGRSEIARLCAQNATLRAAVAAKNANASAQAD
jgi:Basic region leucine zipper